MNQAQDNQQLLGLIRAMHAVQSQLEASLEPLGLSLAKLGVLAKLVDAGEPVSLGTLADRMACVRSNITQLIDRLEVERLVVRIHDPRDRRTVRAALTEQGRARHAAGAAALNEAERRLFEGLDDGQRQRLLELLGGLKPAH
ncbi:MAG: MarR family winged helix-turn-helix transcriptional regulator [Vicinamibacteria bacterium]